MATVRVVMNTCGKHSKVTVTDNGNGTFSVKIVSDCDDVKEYAKRITSITEEDALFITESITNRPENRQIVSPGCLVPSAVISAAQLEMGYLSAELCREAKKNEVIFDV